MPTYYVSNFLERTSQLQLLQLEATFKDHLCDSGRKTQDFVCLAASNHTWNWNQRRPRAPGTFSTAVDVTTRHPFTVTDVDSLYLDR